jgi:hypothetical protein
MTNLQKIFFISLLLLVVQSCGGGEPPNPPVSDNDPPQWDQSVGITSAIAGNKLVTVSWGTATDAQSPPVIYLIFMDTDSNPWDQIPVIKPSNEPFTFTGLINEQEYWFGVRCQDSHNPPNREENIVTKSATPTDAGNIDNSPPVWNNTVGITSIESYDRQLRVHWGVATDAQSPPVEYLVYVDTDMHPWDQTPVIRTTNAPYTFIDVDNGITYWCGVRCRDSANPPNTDSNTVVLSRIPNDEYPPMWDDEEGITAVVPGANSVTVYYGSATEGSSKPVWYMIYKDTDNNPWDKPPVVRSAPGSFTFTGLEIRDYWFGVRCRDSATPPHIDQNSKVLSAKPLNRDWVKTLDCTVNKNNMAIDIDRNIIIAGTFEGNVDLNPGPEFDIHQSDDSRDIFLNKFNNDGILLWSRTWGSRENDDEISGITTDNSGNIYVTGNFQGTVDFDPGSGVEIHSSNDPRFPDIFVSKFTPNGQLNWIFTIGYWLWDTSAGIVMINSSDFILYGDFSGTVDFDPGPGEDNHVAFLSCTPFISKFNIDSTYKWTKSWTGSSISGMYFQDATCDELENIYITGWHDGWVDFDPGSHDDLYYAEREDIFLIKLDQSGGYCWAKAWEGVHGSGSGTSITANDLSEIYFMGTFSGKKDFDPGIEDWEVDERTSDHKDIFLSKYDTDGQYYWTKTWLGSEDDLGYDMTIDSAGNFYITGSYQVSMDFDPGAGVVEYSSMGEEDIFLMKLDSNADYLWALPYGGVQKDEGLSVCIDSFDNAYFSGNFSGSVDFNSGGSVKRFTSTGASDAFFYKLRAAR